MNPSQQNLTDRRDEVPCAALFVPHMKGIRPEEDRSRAFHTKPPAHLAIIED